MMMLHNNSITAKQKLPFIPAHLFKFEEDEKPIQIPIKSLNEHLICSLCDGYFVDATAIIECLHTFCKSCIVKYFLTEKEKRSMSSSTDVSCPVCHVKVSETCPLSSLQLDRTIQDILYKLLPECAKDEENRRFEFYQNRVHMFNRDWDDDTRYNVKNKQNFGHHLTLRDANDTTNEKFADSDDPLITFILIGNIKHADLSYQELKVSSTNTEDGSLLRVEKNIESPVPNVKTNHDCHVDAQEKENLILNATKNINKDFLVDNKKTQNYMNIKAIRKYVRCSERATLQHLSSMILKRFFKDPSQTFGSSPQNLPKISIYLEEQKLNPNFTIKQAAIMAALLINDDTDDSKDEDETIISENFPYFTLRFNIE